MYVEPTSRNRTSSPYRTSINPPTSNPATDPDRTDWIANRAVAVSPSAIVPMNTACSSGSTAQPTGTGTSRVLAAFGSAMGGSAGTGTGSGSSCAATGALPRPATIDDDAECDQHRSETGVPHVDQR